MKITIPEALVAAFRRKALGSPAEILAYLAGTRISENDRLVEVRVQKLLYPPVKSSSCSVEDTWSINDVYRIQVALLPLQLVGTLHSHPNCDPCISKVDIQSAAAIGEAVFGVFSFWKPGKGARRATDLTFYTGTTTVDYEATSEKE